MIEVNTLKHYFRAGRQLSGGGRRIVRAGAMLVAVGAALAASTVWAQYPGQVETKESAPVLRAVAVLEWTGPMGKPTFSRLVPVCIFDGQTLQDGEIYLARPAPLGLDTETEYVLEKDGQRVGLYDIDTAGKQQDAWMGFGKWKPMPPVAPKFANPQLAKVDFDDESSDKPILHRKHHPGEAQSGGNGSGSGGAKPDAAPDAAAGPAPDPDRPVLHRAGGASGGDNGSGSTGDSASASGSATTAGPATASGSATGAARGPASDPDRPTLVRAKKHKAEADVGYVEDLPNITDPDRPRLLRGKPSDQDAVRAPALKGLPPDLEQMVAVSDAVTRPEHVWNYSWANPGDEIKMKSDLETIARDALGLTTAPAKPAPKTKKSRRHAKPAQEQLALPAPLEDERFRVFELAYGSGATMVFSANTGGALKDEKFVTLIAQPDLYGNVAVLLKHVSDGAHLDDSPRMRLVDAVDAMADNRGELLFELRGSSGREFVLYRVIHGQAEKTFTGTPEWFGTEPE